VGESDALLLEQLRRGDEAAFEQLFVRYYHLVYRVLFGLFGDSQQAEDTAQETFVTLLHNPPQLSKQATLSAWLCRVALNRGYNVLRGQRRERARLQRLAEPSEVFDPYSGLLRAEERAHVQALLTEMPERQRDLLLLRYSGLSYAEIAEVLNIASGSVGTLLARAERAFTAAYHAAQVAETADPPSERSK